MNNQGKQQDFAHVTAVIDKYFEGIHNGDVALLAEIFHPDAWLKAPLQRRNLKQWLADVKERSVPAQLGLPYAYRVLSVEVIHHQAMVKAYCPLFDFIYIDFLGLLKEHGRWRIVNKMYVDVKSAHIENE
ncbi:nuclear transport factor 2 family protein [Pseudoalteromonas sp. MMG022]|uniref:nuclear transport factor 2 family protein n=1 Tax=Pseudoalteromonas sp. MMG022 TaxID=2909978 RepID=UPI001F45D58E|nr:nuclear transport factor 2 family protein [Pseudoalteromonas sp. MMG022]MCF6437713.1 nuclear transport factor 2 family protein [Pseudoalteromonas sp. MMG022]